MCGFIAQLVEHRTGIAEVMGSNPVKALIFSGFSFPVAETGKFTAMITFHLVLCTLKKVLRQPHNALTLQVSLLLCDK